MNRLTLAQLLLGASLCFASASLAIDRHIVGAALTVGPAQMSVVRHASAPASHPRGGSNLPNVEVRIAWRAHVLPATRLAAEIFVERERARWT